MWMQLYDHANRFMGRLNIGGLHEDVIHRGWVYVNAARPMSIIADPSTLSELVMPIVRLEVVKPYANSHALRCLNDDDAWTVASTIKLDLLLNRSWLYRARVLRGESVHGLAKEWCKEHYRPAIWPNLLPFYRFARSVLHVAVGPGGSLSEADEKALTDAEERWRSTLVKRAGPG